MPLLIDLKIGESIEIDRPRVLITMLEKHGPRARLSVDADKSVKIEHRKAKSAAGMASDGLTRFSDLRATAKAPV